MHVEPGMSKKDDERRKNRFVASKLKKEIDLVLILHFTKNLNYR